MAIDDPTTWPLGSWIDCHAEKDPDRPALRFDRQTISYAAFAERIDRLVRGLHRKLGLRRGDRIAYLGLNHPDLLTTFFAAARLGLILVPMNWRLATPEHQTILADAAPEVVLVDEPFADPVEALKDARTAWRPIALNFSRNGYIGFEELLEEDGAAGALGHASDPVLIVYTSGTTGLAKGAVLSQDAIRWNAANSWHMHDLTGEDRILTALPLFHAGGLNIQTLPALAAGAEVRLEQRFDPGTTLARIAEEKSTLTVLVPAMMKALIDHPKFAGTDLSSLRQMTTGSSIVPVPLIQAFHDRGVPVTQVYGTTETAPIAVYQRIEDAYHSLGSTGKAAKHGGMRLVGEDNREVPPGASGEIEIRGPQVTTRYWNNPSATSEAFDRGWFRTGDIGRLDESGNLHVEARKDDLIKSGSERIYPSEIENLLRAADDVEDVVVVAKADPDWGEVPVLVVQPVAGTKLQPDQLLGRLEGRIAKFKWPKEVRIVDALPRSALGKILRYRLRAELDQP